MSTCSSQERSAHWPKFAAKRQTSPGKTYHYHLGTPQEMTDDSGEVAWAADLKAWGTVRVKFVRKVENPLRFQGQYHDNCETNVIRPNQIATQAPFSGKQSRSRIKDPGTGIEDIVDNAKQQLGAPSITDLFKAFEFYVDRDAFIRF